MNDTIPDEYRRRAAQGDPNAQLALAWEYMKGDALPKNVDTAFAILRELEVTAPKLARFNIAKMKYLLSDWTFAEEIRGDCDAGFGPALYLMGVYSKQKVGGDNGLREAIEYFLSAARHGHLPSEFQAWKLAKLGARRRLATLIPAYVTFIRMLIIRWRDIDDIRILT